LFLWNIFFIRETHKISNYDHIKFIRCVLIPKNILSFRNHSTFLITYDHIKFVGCVLIPKNTLSLRKHWHLELWSHKVTYKLGRLIKSTKYSFIPESFNISKWKPSGSLQMGLDVLLLHKTLFHSGNTNICNYNHIMFVTNKLGRFIKSTKHSFIFELNQFWLIAGKDFPDWSDENLLFRRNSSACKASTSKPWVYHVFFIMKLIFENDGHSLIRKT